MFLKKLIAFCAFSMIHQSLFAQWGVNDTRTENRDDAGAWGVGVKSGFYQAVAPVNFPGGANSWWHLLDIRHGNTVNNYAMQFAGSFFDQYLYFRKTNNNSAEAWSRVVLEQNGKVGIGTTSPAYGLHIASGNGSGGYGGVSILAENGIGFKAAGVGNYNPGAYIIGRRGANNSRDLAFVTANDGGGDAERVTIQANSGYVGIGTTSPEASLHVSGEGRFNGQGWFSRNNNGNSAVALNLGQNRDFDFPAVQIFTSDDGGSSTASWYSSRWAHQFSFQRQSSIGLKNIFQLGGADGDHWFSLFSRDGATENIKFVADGTSYIQGNVGIGTTNPTSKLTVAGDIHSRKVKVTINAGADFVFAEDYDLKKLKDLQKFIQQHKHLPDIPSAKEMETKGIELGEMNIKLLQKIEELTLYLIRQNKKIDKLEKDNEELKNTNLEIEQIKRMLNSLTQTNQSK